VAPHIAARVFVTGSSTEVAAEVIAAKTITSAIRTRVGRGTRIGAFGETPRGYMALASHGGSCEHGCCNQCSRQNFKLSNSVSP